MKKMRQTLEYIGWFFFPSHFQVDSLTALIHLRSPPSSVLREGQNLENRLHARYFVTRHPSPASRYQRDVHNWGRAAATNTRAGQQRSRLSDAFAPNPCPRRAGQADIWMLFKFGESQLLWVKCAPEHVCSAGLLPHRFITTLQRKTGWKRQYLNQRRVCLRRRSCSFCRRGSSGRGLASHMHPQPPAPEEPSSNSTNGSLRGIWSRKVWHASFHTSYRTVSHTFAYILPPSFAPSLPPRGLPLITADLCSFRLWNDNRAERRRHVACHTFPPIYSSRALWLIPPSSVRHPSIFVCCALFPVNVCLFTTWPKKHAAFLMRGQCGVGSCPFLSI